MINFQRIFLLSYALVGLFGVLIAYKKIKIDKNNYGLTGIFSIYGAFVWADLIIFGAFWFIFSLVIIFLSDWTLFLLAQSLFWFIRSIGETIYWFNQQFSTINRAPVKRFFYAKLFNNDEYTVWFVMQIIFQCFSVVSGILTIYFAKLWLK